jgi:hypothetical protein
MTGVSYKADYPFSILKYSTYNYWILLINFKLYEKSFTNHIINTYLLVGAAWHQDLSPLVFHLLSFDK